MPVHGAWAGSRALRVRSTPAQARLLPTASTAYSWSLGCPANASWVLAPRGQKDTDLASRISLFYRGKDVSLSFCYT